MLIALIAALFCSGLFSHGLDSAIGQSVAGLVSSLVLLSLLWLYRPNASFWRLVRAPLFLFAVALLWLLIVFGVRLASPVNGSDIPYAPDLFLAKYLSILSGVGALLVGAIIGWQRRGHVLTDGMIVCLSIYSAVGLFLAILPPGLFADIVVLQQGRLVGLEGNANVNASVSGVAAVLCLARALPLRRTNWQTVVAGGGGDGAMGLALGIAFVLNFASLLFSASRFAMLMTIVALIALCLHQGFKREWPMPKVALRLGLAVGALIALMIASSSFIVHRTGEITSDVPLRWAMWEHFYAIGTGAPLTGYGPGAFSQANLYFLQYLPRDDVHMIWSVNSPHSVVLQLWSVGGLPYLLFMLAGAALILRDIWRWFKLRNCDSQHLGILLATLILFATGMIDIALDVTASANLAFLLVGMAWVGEVPVKERPDATL